MSKYFYPIDGFDNYIMNDDGVVIDLTSGKRLHYRNRKDGGRTVRLVKDGKEYFRGIQKLIDFHGRDSNYYEDIIDYLYTNGMSVNKISKLLNITHDWIVKVKTERNLKQKIIKVCSECHKEFICMNQVQKYCSDACRDTASKRRWRLKYKSLNERIQRQHLEHRILGLLHQGYKQKDICNKLHCNSSIIKTTWEKYNKNRVIKCSWCGKMFTPKNVRQTRCSNECSRKFARKNNRYKRRAKLKEGKVTLNYIYERDNGICYLCGRRTSYKDCKINDKGYFIVGKTYPSIDHVVPLSKGGANFNDNCRLACHRCNSLKGNKPYTPRGWSNR